MSDVSARMLARISVSVSWAINESQTYDVVVPDGVAVSAGVLAARRRDVRREDVGRRQTVAAVDVTVADQCGRRAVGGGMQ